MMRRIPLLALGTGALGLSSCGQTPEETERARGVLEGVNSVLALSIVFVVVAGAIIVGAIVLDRVVRSRRALEELPEVAPEEEEEIDEPVVAGIGQGSAGVPRWLYAVYVVIPLFALSYIVANADIRAQLGPSEETPAVTGEPDGEGVPTEVDIAAENIQFDKDALTLQANTEVSIVFENNDSVPHNVAIYPTEEDARAEQNGFFVGEIFNGVATQTYTFEAPDPGEFYFHCDVHPNMSGTVTFAEPEEGAEAPEEAEAATAVDITAENVAFDTDELAFPAETEVTITFDNQESLPHNIAIYADEGDAQAQSDPIFQGETFTGPATREYTFTTPEAGEYYFHCDVHPNMSGTVQVT